MYYSMTTKTLFLILIATLSITSSFRDLNLISSASAAEKRQKVIDFEDEVVEGMNKRPLDSANEISERNKHRKKPHLYRKRGGFKAETAESLREMRYTPQ